VTESSFEAGWGLLDLTLLSAAPPEPASIVGLFYPGKRHLVSGEFESGKTWLLLAAAVSEVREGHGVLWIDTDDMGAGDLLERLRALGATEAEVSERFFYAAPDGSASDDDILALAEVVRQHSVRLAVFDSFNATLGLHDLDPNSTADVESFFQRFAGPLCAAGAAIVAIDHVVKNTENRGRYAYGSERKATGVHVHLGVQPLESFGRGVTGRAKLRVHKDRPGFLTRPSAGVFVLASDESGACAWKLEADRSTSDEGEFRPTHLMEKVSRSVEISVEPPSRNLLEQSVQGKAEFVRLAIDRLVEEEFLVEDIGPRKARVYRSLRAFRETAEWGEGATSSHLVPTSSRLSTTFDLVPRPSPKRDEDDVGGLPASDLVPDDGTRSTFGNGHLEDVDDDEIERLHALYLKAEEPPA
jgi:hypothetical protein